MGACLTEEAAKVSDRANLTLRVRHSHPGAGEELPLVKSPHLSTSQCEHGMVIHLSDRHGVCLFSHFLSLSAPPTVCSLSIFRPHLSSHSLPVYGSPISQSGGSIPHRGSVQGCWEGAPACASVSCLICTRSSRLSHTAVFCLLV